MNKRKTQKQATQEKIRQTAKVLFIEQGYEKTTSRQIAQMAKVGLGTVFVHYPNKEAILSAILLADVEEIICKLKPKEEGDIIENLVAQVMPLYSYYARYPELSKVLLKNGLFSEKESDFSLQLQGFLYQIEQQIDAQGYSQANERAQLFMSLYFWLLKQMLDQLDELSDTDSVLLKVARQMKQMLRLAFTNS